MGQRPEAVSVSPRLLSVTVEKTHPGKLDPTVCTVVMHAAAAAARKGEMPFSWLPRRDKVWRQCAGPTARISMNAYGRIVPLSCSNLATPSIPSIQRLSDSPGPTPRISIILHVTALDARLPS